MGVPASSHPMRQVATRKIEMKKDIQEVRYSRTYTVHFTEWSWIPKPRRVGLSNNRIVFGKENLTWSELLEYSARFENTFDTENTQWCDKHDQFDYYDRDGKKIGIVYPVDYEYEVIYKHYHHSGSFNTYSETFSKPLSEDPFKDSLECARKQIGEGHWNVKININCLSLGENEIVKSWNLYKLTERIIEQEIA